MGEKNRIYKIVFYFCNTCLCFLLGARLFLHTHPRTQTDSPFAIVTDDMAALFENVLMVNESLRMVKSVKAVLDDDGYIVQILNPTLASEHKKDFPPQVLDALGSIRTVRKSFPRMSQIVLVPISHS